MKTDRHKDKEADERSDFIPPPCMVTKTPKKEEINKRI